MGETCLKLFNKYCYKKTVTNLQVHGSKAQFSFLIQDLCQLGFEFVIKRDFQLLLLLRVYQILLLNHRNLLEANQIHQHRFDFKSSFCLSKKALRTASLYSLFKIISI